MHQKAQKISRLDTECALLRIHFQLMFPHSDEGLVEIFNVLLLLLGLDDYVVDIYFESMSNHIVEDDIHCPLIRGPFVIVFSIFFDHMGNLIFDFKAQGSFKFFVVEFII